MRLTNISAINIAGQKFNHKLAPVTLFAGPNRRGKTTRMNTAMLVLAGYVPGVNTGRSIFDTYATGNPLQVSGRMDDGTEIGRMWREERGTVKYHGPDAETVKPLPPVLIDAMEYFKLSDDLKMKFMFSRTTLPPELTVPNMTAALTANLKNVKLEENTEATEVVISELVEFISDKPDPSDTPQQWLENLIIHTKERLKLANQNAKRMEQTVQGLAQNKQSSVTAPGDTEARLTKSRADLEAANSEVTRLTTVGQGLAVQLKEAKDKAATATDEQTVRKQIAEHQERKPKAAVAPGSMPAMQVIIKDRPTDTKEREALRTACAKAEEAYRELHTATADMKRLEQAVDDAKKQTTCPTCGHDITDKQKKVVAELKKQLKAATGVHVSKSSVSAIASGHSADATLVRDKAVKSIDDWDRQKTEADTANRTAIAAWNTRLYAHNAAVTALNDWQAQLNTLNAKIGDKSAAEAAAKVPVLEDKITLARADYLLSKGTADMLRQSVADLEDQHKQFVKERGEAATRATAITESAKFKAQALVTGELVDLLGTLQTQIVQASVSPIIASANRLFEAVLGDPLEYHEGEIKMRRNGGLVGFKSLCGAERALCCCAVSLALAAESPIKIAFIDEFRRLDDEEDTQMSLKAMTAIIKLVEDGHIHQALVVDTSVKPYATLDAGGKTFGIIKL